MQFLRLIPIRLALAFCAMAGLALIPASAAAAASSSPARAWTDGAAVVSYSSTGALRRALARVPTRVVRRVPALRLVVVHPRGHLEAYAARIAALPGIISVEPLAPRMSAVEPALAPGPYLFGRAYEWQFAAVREDAVPASVLRAAGSITIAVVDTGADVTAPDLGAKAPTTYSIRGQSSDVRDLNGHGTFVASLAAGSVTNGDGMAGFGGDARLLVVQASDDDGAFTDVDEASGIVYAVDHGAKVINLSLGGPTSSTAERHAVEYAAAHGVLLVAAAGNEFMDGNPVEYPAALLQPEGSNGKGGIGLAVGATTVLGARAGFSNSGSYISLVAPGEGVFGAVSASSTPDEYPRIPLPGSSAGLYTFASGTSFAAPEVAGVAALVWAANPSLSATDVAQILKESASGLGSWNADLGFGVVDAARAVQAATGSPVAAPAPVPLVVPAQATLALLASKGTARALGGVALTAELRSVQPAVGTGRRIVVLEGFTAGTWRTIARATTGASGRATWRVALRRGSLRVRARFLGAADLAGVVSAPLVLHVT